MLRSDDPFEILEKVRPNTYKEGLHGRYGVSATFNVASPSPCFEENEEILSLRSNSNQPGEDDGDHPSKPIQTLPNGVAKVMESNKVREVHAMVRNHLNEMNGEQASSRKSARFCSPVGAESKGGNFLHTPP